MCHKGSPAQRPQRPTGSDDTTQEAHDLDTATCVCSQKATQTDKLIECHNKPCTSGIIFLLSCMNYKGKPNNANTTWICPDCSAANLQNSTAKVNVTNVNSVNAFNILSARKNGNLNNYHYKLILSLTGWLNDDIILEVHLSLKKMDTTVQGPIFHSYLLSQSSNRIANLTVGCLLLHLRHLGSWCSTSLGADGCPKKEKPH